MKNVSEQHLCIVIRSELIPALRTSATASSAVLAYPCASWMIDTASQSEVIYLIKTRKNVQASAKVTVQPSRPGKIVASKCSKKKKSNFSNNFSGAPMLHDRALKIAAGSGYLSVTLMVPFREILQPTHP